MLQQTQVERVIPKYHEFLERYPTLQDLADASADEVRATWYPLGYNIRPFRLHGIARETVARYAGPGTDYAGFMTVAHDLDRIFRKRFSSLVFDGA